ncbi:hypothetical protein D3C87_1448580 [compost metagenome]
MAKRSQSESALALLSSNWYQGRNSEAQMSINPRGALLRAVSAQPAPKLACRARPGES